MFSWLLALVLYIHLTTEKRAGTASILLLYICSLLFAASIAYGVAPLYVEGEMFSLYPIVTAGSLPLLIGGAGKLWYDSIRKLVSWGAVSSRRMTKRVRAWREIRRL